MHVVIITVYIIIRHNNVNNNCVIRVRQCTLAWTQALVNENGKGNGLTR